MNTIVPDIVNVVVVPNHEPLYLYISPGNSLKFKVPGAWAFENWDDVKITCQSSEIIVTKTAPGEIKLTPKVQKVTTTVSFSGNIDIFDGQGYKNYEGKTIVEFRSANEITGLVGLPNDSKVITYQVVQ
jgi:hypothetical protein